MPNSAIGTVEKNKLPLGGVTNLPGTLRPVIWLVVPVLVEQILALSVGFTDNGWPAIFSTALNIWQQWGLWPIV